VVEAFVAKVAKNAAPATAVCGVPDAVRVAETPKRIVRLFVPELAIARSAIPLPSKSATAIELEEGELRPPA